MASKKQDDPLRSFTENITECPICFSTMEQPKQLQCHHGFCLKCLKGHLATRNTRSHQQHVECALCREKTAMPWNGLEGLPSYFMVEQAKDSLKKANRADAAKGNSQSRCKTHRRVLDRWCISCTELICGDCRGHSYHDTRTVYEANDEVDNLFEKCLKENYESKTKIDKMKDYKQTLNRQKDDCVESAIRRARDGFERQLMSIKREAAEIEKKHLGQLDQTLKKLETTYTTSKNIADDFQRDRGNVQQKLPYLKRLQPSRTKDLDAAALFMLNHSDPFSRLSQLRFDDPLTSPVGQHGHTSVARGRSSGDIRGVTSSMPEDMRSSCLGIIQDVFKDHLESERSNAIVRRMNDKYGKSWNCFIGGNQAEISHGFEPEYTFKARVDGNVLILSKAPSIDENCFPNGTISRPVIINSSVDMETCEVALTLLNKRLEEGGCTRNDIAKCMRTFGDKLRTSGLRRSQHHDAWQCIVAGGHIAMQKASGSSKHILIRVGQERILLFKC